MTTEQMRDDIHQIINQAAFDAQAAFKQLPDEIVAPDNVRTILDAHVGEKLIERLQRIASQYGIPAQGTQSFRAHLKGTQTPCDRSKPIVAKLEVENTHENKLILAQIDMAAVNVYGSQLELDMDGEEDEDDGQEELDLEGEYEEAVGE